MLILLLHVALSGTYTSQSFGFHLPPFVPSIASRHTSPISYAASYIATMFSGGLTAWRLWQGPRM